MEMKKRKITLNTSANGRFCIANDCLNNIICDVLDGEGEYFVDIQFITEKINGFYSDEPDIKQNKISLMLRALIDDGRVIAKHSLLQPRHTRYYSLAKNQPKQ